jgi:hypothetical protein
MRPRDILFYHGMKGVVGVNTSDATATVAQILLSQTAYGPTGAKLTGTMPNNGAMTLTPGASVVAIPAGYHNGSGTVPAVVVPAANVLTGTTIAGTAGTMPNNGAGGTVTPGTANQTKAAGYWSSLITILGDANLLAANLKNGISVFGVTGNLLTATGNATVGDVASGLTFSNTTSTGLTGTGGNVKRWATGTATPTVETSSYYYYYIQVMGLAFRPTTVVGLYSNGAMCAAFHMFGTTSASNLGYNNATQSPYIVKTTGYYDTASLACHTSFANGFKLAVDQNNTILTLGNVTWIAIE